jgi:HK97 family phage major capsid protein
MDWQKIVKACKANGYTGSDNDLAAVKAFVTENLDIQGEDGTPVDLDAAHSKATKAAKPKAKLVLTDDGDELAKLTAERDAFRDQARKAASAAVRGVVEGDGRATPQPFFIGDAVAKSYDRKAKEGRNKTSFATAEEAEMFGSLIATTLLPHKATKRMREIADAAVKANIGTTNTSGGFSVPDLFIPTLIDLKELRGALRQVMTVTSVSRDRVEFPRRTAGVTVYAPGEGGNITESNPAGNNVAVTANKLAAITRVSNELLSGSAISFGDWVARELAYAFADKEDEIGFNGDGTSTYFGFTGFREALKGLSGTIANIAGLKVGTGNAYSELTLTDFESVVGLAPSYVRDGVWVVHKQFYYEVMLRLALAGGGVTAAEIGNGMRVPMFLGSPVVFAQVMPRIEANSQVCALYGDFNMAAKAIDVGGVQLATDTGGDNFTADVTAFRGIDRFGFTAHDVGNASATAASRVPGPVVGLITAAS